MDHQFQRTFYLFGASKMCWLILQQLMVTAPSRGRTSISPEASTGSAVDGVIMKPFAKPGFLTILICFCGAFPFFWELCRSLDSNAIWKPWMWCNTALSHCLLYLGFQPRDVQWTTGVLAEPTPPSNPPPSDLPCSASNQETEGETPSLSPAAPALERRSPPVHFSLRKLHDTLRKSKAVRLLRSPEGWMLTVPALCEVIGLWCELLGLVSMPWLSWICLRFCSVAAMSYVAQKALNRQPQFHHTSGILLIALGAIFLWVVNAALVSAAVPQIFTKSQVPDQLLTFGAMSMGSPSGDPSLSQKRPLRFNVSVDQSFTSVTTAAALSSFPPSETVARRYIYSSGWRSLLVVLGGIVRVLGIAIQDLLQLSMGIPPDSAAAVHGIEAFLLSVVLIPIAGMMLSGGDWNGRLEDLWDTVVMVKHNPGRILSIGTLFVAVGCLVNVAALQLNGNVSGLHLAITQIGQLATAFLAVGLGNTFHMWQTDPQVTFSSYSAILMELLGIASATLGLLVFSSIIKILPGCGHSEFVSPNGAYKENNWFTPSSYAQSVLPSATLDLHTAIVHMPCGMPLSEVDVFCCGSDQSMPRNSCSFASAQRIVPPESSQDATTIRTLKRKHHDNNVLGAYEQPLLQRSSTLGPHDWHWDQFTVFAPRIHGVQGYGEPDPRASSAALGDDQSGIGF